MTYFILYYENDDRRVPTIDLRLKTLFFLFGKFCQDLFKIVV